MREEGQKGSVELDPVRRWSFILTVEEDQRLDKGEDEQVEEAEEVDQGCQSNGK